MFLKLAPSVTSMLNIGRDPGESLFSGGENGKGEITVSLHDSNFRPSTSRHHAASMIGVELMYYCTGTDAGQRRGNRVVTKDVCCLCCVGTDIVPPDKVKRRQKSVVQKPLPVCCSCLDLNVKIPCGATNYVKMREQAKVKKAELAKKVAANGRKKRHSGR